MFKLYHSSVAQTEKQIYPSIISVGEMNESLGDDSPAFPRLRICSVEDLDVGVYLVDQGSTLFLIEFYREESKPDEDFDRRIEDASQSSDSGEPQVLIYRYLDYSELDQNQVQAVTKFLLFEYGDHPEEVISSGHKLGLHPFKHPRFFCPPEIT